MESSEVNVGGYIHTFTNTRAERDARVTAGRKEAAEEEREEDEEEGGLGACVDRRKTSEVELTKIENL